ERAGLRRGDSTLSAGAGHRSTPCGGVHPPGRELRGAGEIRGLDYVLPAGQGSARRPRRRRRTEHRSCREAATRQATPRRSVSAETTGRAVRQRWALRPRYRVLRKGDNPRSAFTQAFFTLARFYEAEERDAEALRAYEQGLALDPNDTQARNNREK